jgi:hypothetical protein
MSMGVRRRGCQCMSDNIEVYFDPERGQLSLACDEEAFARIRDFVFEEALVPEIADSDSEVRRIEIEWAPAALADRRSRLRSPAVLRSYLMLAAYLVVFDAGVWTILHWALRLLA